MHVRTAKLVIVCGGRETSKHMQECQTSPYSAFCLERKGNNDIGYRAREMRNL